MTSETPGFWSFERLARKLGGTWVREPDDASAPPLGASIDTRTLRAGEAFFALRGERTDGRGFLPAAAEAGSSLAVVDGEIGQAPAGLAVLRVDDARAGLGRLASAWRDELAAAGTRVIAVTGSNGKTTTVRLIDAVLSAGLSGTRSAKSFNNDLGLPLTLLAARPEHGYVVCEVGINAPGEMAPLAAIARPDVAVITSIGRAHLEALGSVAGVALEKSALLDSAPTGGAWVVTADSVELRAELERRRGAAAERRMLLVGEAADADLRVEDINPTKDGAAFRTVSGGEWASWRVPLEGRHNAGNAAIAVAVGRLLGLADERIREGLAHARGEAMRLERLTLELPGGAATILNDAYNANPDSTAAAIRLLAEQHGPGVRRRVAVLGDMLEMGDHGPAAHEEVGRLLAQTGAADLAVLVGEQMSRAVGPATAFDGVADGGVDGEAGPQAGPALEVAWLDSLDDGGANRVAAMIRPGDLVLLKGSRGMGLERVLTALAG